MFELFWAYTRSAEFFQSLGNLARDQAFQIHQDPSLLSRLGAAVSMQEAQKEAQAASAAIREAFGRASSNWSLAKAARNEAWSLLD